MQRVLTHFIKKMTISLEQNNLYRAIGELAYVVAKIDGIISPMERLVFQEAIKEELGKNSWFAKASFDALDNQNVKFTVEETYNRVMFNIRQNKSALNEEIIIRFISILEKVGGVSGITDIEIGVIEKFKDSVTKILNK